MKKIFPLLLVAILTFSCNTDDDNTPLPIDVNIIFNLTQDWDGVIVTNTNFDSTVYTNQKGHEIFISRIRYLLSRITLTNTTSNEIFELVDYHLIDMDDSTSLSLDTNTEIPEGTYKLSFVYGFNEADNVDEGYPDLNTASWNWPDPLGGGYHFMQFDGKYDVNTTVKPFNYHHGTAKVSGGVFEQNFVEFQLTNDLVIEEGKSIEIKMNIAEWFKNPYTWDLDVYNTPLMPNYDAQKFMQQNAATVFSAEVN